MKKNNFWIIPKLILTANSNDDVLRNYAVKIEDGIISRISPAREIEQSNSDITKITFPDYTLIPGFVQTHVHLCQTLFRGLAEDLELLDWLQYRIFPYEYAHNKFSLGSSAKLGIHELQTSGTTTILDMGTLKHQEIIFEELINSGMRAIAGKCMIDQNELFPRLKEKTESSIKSTYELAKEFHNKENGMLKYGFAPRFVLSCSEILLVEAMMMTRDFAGSIYHTHSSENKSEIEEVRKQRGMENIDYLDYIGVAKNNTVLAHCIHVKDYETKILKENSVRVSHCPSSNLKLGSGIANIPRYIDEGISVSLGADGAPCNNSLSIFNEMRLASLIQKPIHGPKAISAKKIFRLATIEGAKALHLQNEIGSIEVGKKADLALLDLNSSRNTLLDNDENIYSSLVYSASDHSVKEVMINGRWVVKNSKSLIYDEGELVHDSSKELKKLLKRVKT